MNYEFIELEDSIAARSTGEGNAAISIIRITGNFTIESWKGFLGLKCEIVPRKFYNTDLIFDNQIVDNILLVFFKAPHSYTGQNLLEFHLHGNLLNTNFILDKIIDAKLARKAFPGEFSFRAFKKGKLSLSQIEGLDLLLNAATPLAAQQGISLASGKLHRELNALRDSYLKLRYSVEANIDFLDDIGEEQALSVLERNWKFFFNFIDLIYKRSIIEIKGILTPSITFFGPTNAGKSSLFNFFLKYERSIVSDIEGTTRDFVSESLQHKGIIYKLVDTAGIRPNASNSIEVLGIEKAKDVTCDSLIKVLVVSPRSNQINDKEWENLREIGIDCIVCTHADWVNFNEWFELNIRPNLGENINGPIFITSLLPNNEISKSGPIEPEKVFVQILDLASNKFKEISDKGPFLLERHRELIGKIYQELIEINDNWSFLSREPLLLSLELQIVSPLIDELLGIVCPNEVLDSLFNNFCIGK